jgi:predicted kinase
MSSARLVIVSGLPGVGKSQVAARIARRFALVLLSKDAIKEILFDTLGTGEPRWSGMLSNASFAALFAVAGQILQAGGEVLLEGNFRAGEHESKLLPVLALRPCGVTQVLCRLPEEARLQRLEQRAARAERHPGHLDRLFQRRFAQRAGPDSDFLDLPGTRIVHDTEGNADDAWARLVPDLDLALKTAGEPA